MMVLPGMALPPPTTVAVLVADRTGANGLAAEVLIAAFAHGPNEFSEAEK
jgi:hypothetical protein